MPLGGNKSFVDGLKDLNFTLNAKPRFKLPYFYNTDFLVRYFHFNDQLTGAHLANEWDAQVLAVITPKLGIGLKYANFKRVDSVPLGTAAPPPSRQKFWITLEYKL
jgi:hypothetical protein